MQQSQLGIYPDKSKIWKDTCTWMFITALFTVAKTRNHPQFSSVAQSCPTLHDPMDHCMSGLPVHHQLPESTQTHVHRVNDTIQPSHPLSSPYPPAFNLSQHQGLFQMSQFFTSGGQSIGISASASVLPKNIQDWCPLWWTGWSSSPRDSQEPSPTPQFKNINSLALSFLHSPTLTSIHDHWKKRSLD